MSNKPTEGHWEIALKFSNLMSNEHQTKIARMVNFFAKKMALWNQKLLKQINQNVDTDFRHRVNEEIMQTLESARKPEDRKKINIDEIKLTKSVNQAIKRTDEHDEQIEEVLAKMEEDPSAVGIESRCYLLAANLLWVIRSDKVRANKFGLKAMQMENVSQELQLYLEGTEIEVEALQRCLKEINQELGITTNGKKKLKGFGITAKDAATVFFGSDQKKADAVRKAFGRGFSSKNLNPIYPIKRIKIARGRGTDIYNPDEAAEFLWNAYEEKRPNNISTLQDLKIVMRKRCHEDEE